MAVSALGWTAPPCTVLHAPHNPHIATAAATAAFKLSQPCLRVNKMAARCSALDDGTSAMGMRTPTARDMLHEMPRASLPT